MTSLFDAPPTSSVALAAARLSASIPGKIAFGLCVLAVAFLLMTGHFAFLDAVRVAMGCFVLLGASTIADGLLLIIQSKTPSGVVIEPAVEVQALPPLPPPTNYDPYAVLRFDKSDGL